MERRIVVLIACFFTVLIAYCIRYGYGVLLPDMLVSLEISKTEAGVIYAFFFIAYTVFSPLLGTLGDRYSLRLLIVIFVLVLGAGTLLMAFASSLIQAILYAGRHRFGGLLGTRNGACPEIDTGSAQGQDAGFCGYWQCTRYRGQQYRITAYCRYMGVEDRLADSGYCRTGDRSHGLFNAQEPSRRAGRAQIR